MAILRGRLVTSKAYQASGDRLGRLRSTAIEYASAALMPCACRMTAT
ncbi:hypothetical protein GLA29479_1042 [Lysobacter antibioticus]|nr:hypothetical protein GLA29479_1042 [Lysobacter antibioticus]